MERECIDRIGVLSQYHFKKVQKCGPIERSKGQSITYRVSHPIVHDILSCFVLGIALRCEFSPSLSAKRNSLKHSRKISTNDGMGNSVVHALSTRSDLGDLTD